jgi:hypothetical protein
LLDAAGDVTMVDMPIACSLDGAALACRQSDLRAGVLAEAESVERLSDGYRWSFRHAPDLFARLGPIIDAERHCCRFLRFAIQADQDQGMVTIEITGPEGTVEFLESWIQRRD